jgi:hypothetical protein
VGVGNRAGERASLDVQASARGRAGRGGSAVPRCGLPLAGPWGLYAPYGAWFGGAGMAARGQVLRAWAATRR